MKIDCCDWWHIKERKNMEIITTMIRYTKERIDVPFCQLRKESLCDEVNKIQMQLDGWHLYVNDVLSPWIFPFEFNALNHSNQYSFFIPCVLYKTQLSPLLFPYPRAASPPPRTVSFKVALKVVAVMQHGAETTRRPAGSMVDERRLPQSPVVNDELMLFIIRFTLSYFYFWHIH
jgi:hypothetical protein